MATETLSLRKGNKLVYPGHGVVRVIGRTEEPWIDGETIKMVTFETMAKDNSAIVLKIAVDQVAERGIRNVVDPKVAKKALQRIADQSVEVREPGNWSRRLKMNQERVKSPDLLDVVEVLCALAGRLRETRHLSVAERRLMNHAENLVSAEIAASLGRDDEEVLADIRRDLS